MKKGILAFIFTLIVFMAAVGFGRNLQTNEQALSRPNVTIQTAITAPLDRGGDWFASQIILVFRPLSGISLDVLPYLQIILLIADHMLII